MIRFVEYCKMDVVVIVEYFKWGDFEFWEVLECVIDCVEMVNLYINVINCLFYECVWE